MTKVSGCLSLVGGEGRETWLERVRRVEEGRECGGEGNVMVETLESGGREGTVVRETGLIEGNMVVDPRRELDAGGREEMNTPSSEFDAEAEDDIELGSETPPMNTK